MARASSASVKRLISGATKPCASFSSSLRVPPFIEPHVNRHWHHFGCATPKQIASLKASYDAPTEIDGFGELKSAEQEKVKRVWEAGEVPDEDKGAGEAVETAKKVPVKRKKDQDGEERECL